MCNEQNLLSPFWKKAFCPFPACREALCWMLLFLCWLGQERPVSASKGCQKRLEQLERSFYKDRTSERRREVLLRLRKLFAKKGRLCWGEAQAAAMAGQLSPWVLQVGKELRLHLLGQAVNHYALAVQWSRRGSRQGKRYQKELRRAQQRFEEYVAKSRRWKREAVSRDKNKVARGGLIIEPVLAPVLFAFDKDAISSPGEALLQSMKKLLRPLLQVKGVTCELTGHTDNVGSASYNLKLSRRRAQSVRSFLLAKGLPGSRFQIRWRGKSNPVATNSTAEGRALNRRVEFRLIRATAQRPPRQRRRSPRSYALLVGISRYKRINSLTWPAHDVERMRKVLPLYGFPRQQTVVLKNEKATKEAIVAQLEWLRRVSLPGDRVLFYFGGHGSQVPDQDGDEPDNKDETLAPYDASPAGHTHLRDDWLALWTQELKSRKLLLIFDSCFSGGASRGGGKNKQEQARYWPNPAVQHLGSSKSKARKIMILPRSPAYVLLAASQANERAWENHSLRGGIFTLALVRALKKLRRHRKSTFATLWQQIERQRMQPIFRLYRSRQHPLLLGDRDKPLLFR
jgi:outer membrane protein OmpA-like peptidoglycan-associated protein/uncharacterized caspase-like protein